MAAGDVSVKVPRSEVIQKLEEVIAREQREYEQAMEKYERDMARWIDRAERGFHDAVAKLDLTDPSTYSSLRRLPSDKVRIEVEVRYTSAAGDKPNAPTKPPCRQNTLDRLRAGTNEHLTLNDGQWVTLLGSSC